MARAANLHVLVVGILARALRQLLYAAASVACTSYCQRRNRGGKCRMCGTERCERWSEAHRASRVVKDAQHVDHLAVRPRTFPLHKW
jgi:hypothetical protein